MAASQLQDAGGMIQLRDLLHFERSPNPAGTKQQAHGIERRKKNHNHIHPHSS